MPNIAKLILTFSPICSDFDSLTSENILYNNNLAFSIGQQKLGIPALLDAEDMLLAEPDRASIALYLSEVYECFEGSKKPNRRRSAIFNRSYSNGSTVSGSSNTSSPTTPTTPAYTTIKPVKF